MCAWSLPTTCAGHKIWHEIRVHVSWRLSMAFFLLEYVTLIILVAFTSVQSVIGLPPSGYQLERVELSYCCRACADWTGHMRPQMRSHSYRQAEPCLQFRCVGCRLCTCAGAPRKTLMPRKRRLKRCSMGLGENDVPESSGAGPPAVRAFSPSRLVQSSLSMGCLLPVCWHWHCHWRCAMLVRWETGFVLPSGFVGFGPAAKL